MNLSLEGKHALVCGASEGIGYAVAVELALLGASCILLARKEEKLAAAMRSLHKAGKQEHRYFSVDLGNQLATQQLIETITGQHNIHILVNNSGGPAAGPITEAKEEQFLQGFQQHVLTSHILTKAVAGGMKKEGYGRIINIISTSVRIPLKNLGVSNTIRGAMASWAKSMSNELAPFGITVNNVLPGMTSTARLDALVAHMAVASGQSTEATAEKMRTEIPAGRFGEAAEIAALAAFLATPAAAYINGTSIPVDGGRTGSI